LLGAKSTNWHRLGLGEGAADLVAAASSAIADYEAELRQKMATAHVEIIGIVEVDHFELVKRAAGRQRPCNQNGDGYRDTLLWLGALELAAQSGSDRVTVVTRDTDFAADGKQGLHQDMKDEAALVVPGVQVDLSESLEALLIELASSGPGAETPSLKGILDQLTESALKRFASTVIDSQVQSGLPPESFGLPAALEACVVESVVVEGDLVRTAEVHVGHRLAEITGSVDAEVSLLVAAPEGQTLVGPLVEPLVEVPGTTQFRVVRKVAFEVKIQVDDFGRPHLGYLMSVETPDGDRTVDQFSLVRNANEREDRARSSGVDSPMSAVAEAARKLNSGLSSEWLEYVKAAQKMNREFAPQWLADAKAAQKLNLELSSEWLEYVKAAQKLHQELSAQLSAGLKSTKSDAIPSESQPVEIEEAAPSKDKIANDETDTVDPVNGEGETSDHRTAEENPTD